MTKYRDLNVFLKAMIWVGGAFGFFLLIGLYSTYTEGINANVIIDKQKIPNLNNTLINNPEEKVLEVEKKLLPETSYSCDELAPENLIILRREMLPTMNFLKNGEILQATFRGYQSGRQCVWHAKAKPGEYVWVGKLFTCWGESGGGGGTTEEGIVKRSYKISFKFDMDERKCADSYDKIKPCEIISLTCDWAYTN